MDPPPGPVPSSWDDDDLEQWELIPSPTNTIETTTYEPPARKPTAQDGLEVAVVAGGDSAAASASSLRLQKNPIMPGWKDDYLSSLLEAERNSPVNLALVDACSQLNDKIALLEAEKAQAVQPPLSASTTTPSSPPIPSASTTLPSTDPVLLRLRADLAQALRQNTALATRLRAATADRDRLQGLTKTQEATIATLTTERGALSRRVRDQAEELRGKKQMLEQVQDEVLTLEMQLNVAEQQKTKIAAENKNLIDRWMRRAELEAREMNAANERGGPEGT